MTAKTETITKHPRLPALLSRLREIRRANAGIQACTAILNEHSSNQECTPDVPGVYIQLTVHDAAALMFAIETSSRFIDEAFENLPVLGDVMWDEGYLPNVRREAEYLQLMVAGTIDYQEYTRRCAKLNRQ